MTNVLLRGRTWVHAPAPCLSRKGRTSAAAPRRSPIHWGIPNRERFRPRGGWLSETRALLRPRPAKPPDTRSETRKGPLLLRATGPFERSRRRPTLPRRVRRSTIGAEGFHFRVRDGNGWVTFAIVTENWDLHPPAARFFGGRRKAYWPILCPTRVLERGSSSLVVKPHGPLVQVSFTHCCASTSCLSTS